MTLSSSQRAESSLSTTGPKPFSSAKESSPSHYHTSLSTRYAPTQCYSMLSSLCQSPLAGPAFVIPATYSKGLIPFRHGKFDSILKLVASRADLDPSRIRGHSLRAGEATQAFQANIPEELIKSLGDWWSDAFRSYIHIPIKYRMHAIHQVVLFV